MCVFMCNYVHRSAKCHQRPQEGARFSGAGVLGAYVTLCLGTELGSSARTVQALNCGVASPAWVSVFIH